MTKNTQNSEIKPFFSRHLFGFMIIGSILTAVLLVIISMALYYWSGASQLDLSSPSYVDVRNQIDSSNDSVQYSNTGKINSNAISDFKTLFNQKVEKAKSVDAFSGDPLNPESLGMADVDSATLTE